MTRATGVGADLPWGSDLRVNASFVEDGQGRRWRSVREAFWVGHLGFPLPHFVAEQHELLSRVLEARDARRHHGWESSDDLFGGNWVFLRFYGCWLQSVGLVDAPSGMHDLDAPLTDLGRSVLAMLRATREPQWMSLPIGDVIAAVRNAGRTTADEEREQALRDFERQVAHLPSVFAREAVPGLHLVTLTGAGTGARMPVKRVMWSQSFSDERVRDDFFGWLAEHLDRWEDWSEMAFSSGAATLTQHLFGLFVARFSTS